MMTTTMTTTATTTTLPTARMQHPVFAVAGAMDAMHALNKAMSRARLPIDTELVHLRASQINGCSVCVDMHAKALHRSGAAPEKIAAVAAWRETPYFTESERAALGLTEALTRCADRTDQVPDDVWQAAADQFDEVQLGALVIDIATINWWNRTNIATRQVVGGDHA